MSEGITEAVLWISTHGQTCAAIALTFIVGAVYGMWIEFKNNDDKQKAAKRWHA